MQRKVYPLTSGGGGHRVTLPQAWIHWLQKHGYSIREVDMVIRGGQLVIRPIKAIELKGDPSVHNGNHTDQV